jgi:hypothetical protein
LSRAVSMVVRTSASAWAAPTWRDDRFFISQDLSRLAKTLYEDARKELRIKSTPLRLAA